MTYAMQVTGFMNWVVRQATLGEAQMNAVERIQYYGQVASEADWEIPDRKPPPAWPSVPTINFVPILLILTIFCSLSLRRCRTRSACGIVLGCRRS